MRRRRDALLAAVLGHQNESASPTPPVIVRIPRNGRDAGEDHRPEAEQIADAVARGDRTCVVYC
jgi:hypothetical protein